MNAHQKIIKDNVRSILKIITNHYGVKYSAALYQILKEHPDFPSFLSFQYILHRMGKDSFAIHTSYEELTNMPAPFIVHGVTNVDLFLFITKATAESVQIIDEKGKEESIKKEDFEKMWDGNILIIDNLPGKINIPSKSKLDLFIKLAKYPFLILCLVALCTYSLILKGVGDILFYVYLLVLLGGLGTSILLFIEQIDKYNVHIKRLCSSNGSKSNIDCSSILDFKDAYFMGLASWSDIGFVYFTSLLTILLVLPFGTSQAFINILSLFSIGYVCYSLFYQKFVAQKWCTLCLSVQTIFIFLFILSICTITINGIYELLNTKSVIDIIMIFLVTASTYAVTKPLIASQKEYTALKKKFNELIYDENIIQYLFQQELHLTDIDEVSKLSIGNTNAETCLTVVFSPICVSCIKELQILMRILQRKDNIKLDLIFLLDKKKHPESLIIAKHLLSDYQKSPEQFITILQKYVDDYPISKNKIMQDTKFLQEAPQYDSYLNAQEKWCRNHKLYSTPILFINGNKLPNYYNIKDIDYLYS